MFSSLTPEYLGVIAVELVCIVFSVMVHEVAHGYAAYRLGDPTAKRAGRLTLNPVKHLDPVGSVALPLIFALCNAPIFAYAKPVPYNPAYFKDLKKGELVVAFAGPLSNVAQGLVGALVCFLCRYAYAGTDPAGFGATVLTWTFTFGYYYCYINFVLFFFNVIPLPPLDGASIVAVFLSERGLRKFYRVKQYSMFILLALLVLVPMVLGWSPLGWYMRHTAGAAVSLLVG